DDRRRLVPATVTKPFKRRHARAGSDNTFGASGATSVRRWPDLAEVGASRTGVGDAGPHHWRTSVSTRIAVIRPSRRGIMPSGVPFRRGHAAGGGTACGGGQP